ncbi:unnamed protein product [Owenia fusiformis]|uniref:ZMYND8 n=1 Tax=Owenia fusiformis TaxID=6347 RepID=A0A8S4N419_OWEFU|nr:unnamed protein product [Owenia fusiformis]
MSKTDAEADKLTRRGADTKFIGKSEKGNTMNEKTALDQPLALRKSARSSAGINLSKLETMASVTAALTRNSKPEPDPKPLTPKATTKLSKLKNSEDSPKITPTKASRESPPATSKHRTPPSAGGEGGRGPKLRRRDSGRPDSQNDFFCWVCHKEGNVICCELCPRVYHVKCLLMDHEPPGDWVCPECQKIMKAECVDSRSPSMAQVTIDQLCVLLKFALQRMKHQGSEPFQTPVNLNLVPNYTDYIFHPMDLAVIEKNIKKKQYGCTEAFLADCKWILHNCIIFNGLHHKLTAAAKMILKVCKHEMNEIEICPDCYMNSCIKRNDNWFCEPCRTPHTLVWAKLKGYPYWPAKVIKEAGDNIDVRFFGAYDRAWVTTSQIYMISKQCPISVTKRKQGFEESVAELELHIKRLQEKFGPFAYYPYRTPYDSDYPYSYNRIQKSPQKSKRKQVHSPSDLSSVKGKLISPVQESSSVKAAKVVLKKVLKSSSDKTDLRSPLSKRRRFMKLDTNSSTDVSKSETVFAGNSIGKDRIKSETESVDNSSETDKEITKPVHTKSERKATRSKSGDVKTESEVVKHEKETLNTEPSLVESKNISGTFGAIDQKTSSIENTESITNPQVNPSKAESKDNKERNPTKPTDSNTIKTDSESKSTDNRAVIEALPATPDPERPVTPADIDSEDDDDVTIRPSIDLTKTPPKADKFHENLQKTIASCKAKLGMSGDSDQGEVDSEEASLEEEDSEASTPGETSSEESEHSNSSEEDATLGSPESSPEKLTTDLVEQSSSESASLASEQPVTAVSENMPETIEEIPPETTDTTESPMSLNPKEPPNQKTSPPVETSKSNKSPQPEELTSITNDNAVEHMEVDEPKTDSELAQAVDSNTKPTDSSNPENPKLKDNAYTQQIDKLEAGDKPEKQVAEKSVIEAENKSEKHQAGKFVIEAEEESEDSDPDHLVIDMETSSESPQPPMKIAKKSSPLPEDILTADKKSSPSPSTKNDEQKLNNGEKWQQKRLQREAEKEKATKMSLIKKTIVQSLQSQVQSLQPILPKPGGNASPALSLTKVQPGSMGQAKALGQAQTPPQSIHGKQMEQQIHQSSIQKLTNITQGLQDPKASGDNKRITPDVAKTKPSMADVQLMTQPPICVDKYADKVTGALKQAMAEMYTDVVQSNAASVHFKQEIEKMQWAFQQELLEFKHNAELTIIEMRANLENDKQRSLNNMRSMFDKELEQAVEETKKKQWCANCGKEAIFYCCWNTSYCDYPCQQSHWPKHMATCTQGGTQGEQGGQADGEPTQQPPLHPPPQQNEGGGLVYNTQPNNATIFVNPQQVSMANMGPRLVGPIMQQGQFGPNNNNGVQSVMYPLLRSQPPQMGVPPRSMVLTQQFHPRGMPRWNNQGRPY